MNAMKLLVNFTIALVAAAISLIAVALAQDSKPIPRDQFLELENVELRIQLLQANFNEIVGRRVAIRESICNGAKVELAECQINMDTKSVTRVPAKTLPTAAAKGTN